MTDLTTPKSTNRVSYLKVMQRFPFCKGCGHQHVTNAIDAALVRLEIEPHNVNITSDIGCVGLVDTLFENVHSLHTTHGRSTAFATGVEIADSILADSKLKNLVVIGDGGAMIGLLHLVNAALSSSSCAVSCSLCSRSIFASEIKKSLTRVSQASPAACIYFSSDSISLSIASSRIDIIVSLISGSVFGIYAGTGCGAFRRKRDPEERQPDNSRHRLLCL